MRRILLAIALLLTGASARAEQLSARDTAAVQPKGGWSVGVFNPLRYALGDKLEIETHPLFFLFAPNATVRVAHANVGGVQLTGEYGLSLPKGGLDLLRRRAWGMKIPEPVMFLPTWFEGNDHVGWFLQPSAGLVASGKVGEKDVWTGRADLAVGIPLGSNSALPLDSGLTPLDLATAPALTGYRARVGGLYDKALTEGLRLRGELNVYRTGNHPDTLVQLSPWFVTAGVALDVAVGAHSRFTVGGMWFNHDTHRLDVSAGSDGYAQKSYGRSNDFLPTIDFIWAG